MTYRFAWTTALVAAVILAIVACSTNDNQQSAAVDTSSDAGTGETVAIETTGDHERAVRTFRFTYFVTVPASDDTGELRIWVPLPLTDPGVQEFKDLEINAPFGATTTTETAYGNQMIYVTVANPIEDVTISWTATITRWEDAGQGSQPTQDRYLAANSLIPVTGAPRIAAEELGIADANVAVADRAAKLYYSVLDGMTYGKGGTIFDPHTGMGWGGGSLKHAMQVCEGNCTDFHARFIGIGRAAGIPIRFTMGIPMKSDAVGTYDSYHCWAHWYDGANWQPVDISEADKVQKQHEGDGYADKAQWFHGHLGEDRLALSIGRDIVLEPAQAGAPLNYFVFPYAEADGREVPMSKQTNWHFEYETIVE